MRTSLEHTNSGKGPGDESKLFHVSSPKLCHQSHPVDEISHIVVVTVGIAAVITAVVTVPITWLCEPEKVSAYPLSPGLDVVEQVLPALVDALDLVTDLALPGLVAGRDELLSELLQVSLVLTEQVDLLHAVLQRQGEGNKFSIIYLWSFRLCPVWHTLDSAKLCSLLRNIYKKERDSWITDTWSKEYFSGVLCWWPSNKLTQYYTEVFGEEK